MTTHRNTQFSSISFTVPTPHCLNPPPHDCLSRGSHYIDLLLQWCFSFHHFCSLVAGTFVQIWAQWLLCACMLTKCVPKLHVCEHWCILLPIILLSAVAFHTVNWHGGPTQGEQFTWPVAWFYIITLTITLSEKMWRPVRASVSIIVLSKCSGTSFDAEIPPTHL